MHSLNILLVIMVTYQGASLVQGSFPGQAPKKFCGSELPLVLAAVCYDRYDTLLQKRGGDGGIFNAMSELSLNDREDFNWPWVQPHRARLLSMSGRRRDKRYGVVEECCEKSCTIAELQSYC